MTSGINTTSWAQLMKLASQVTGKTDISTEELQKLLKEADKNGDGILELQEFKDAFLTSEEYMKLEEEFLEAFEEISKLDKEAESISEKDIADAIAEYDKANVEEVAPPPSGGGGGGGGGGTGGGGGNNGGDKPTTEDTDTPTTEEPPKDADVNDPGTQEPQYGYMGSADSPKTGDATPIVILILAMVMSSAGMIIFKKKFEE